MFAETFFGCHTMFPSTNPYVVFVVYKEPRSVKLSSVSSLASKRQNCAPSSLFPHPTPTYHLPKYSNARTGSRYPVLILAGIGIVGPRCVQVLRPLSAATADPIAPLPGPPMMGQNAYTPDGVGDTEPVSPLKLVVPFVKLPFQ